MSVNDSSDESVAYTDETRSTLVEGYNKLPTHAFAGFTIVQNDEGRWVGRLEVNEITGAGGYLHGGLTYAFLDVISSYQLESQLGPWFYSRTVDTQASMLRAPRVGTVVEFRGQVDRVAGGIAQTRAEAWALLPEGAKLVATGSASKKVMSRRERPRPGDIDPSALG